MEPKEVQMEGGAQTRVAQAVISAQAPWKVMQLVTMRRGRRVGRRTAGGGGGGGGCDSPAGKGRVIWDDHEIDP